MTALRVVDPGLFTTIQDLGRGHAVAMGIPAGGAMDRFAHRAANRLVGNDDGSATLECTLRGPVLEACEPCTVAVTGGDLELTVNGSAAPAWTTIRLAAGDRLALGRRRSGARAYVGIAGGLSGDRWLGSLSTNTMLACGGMHGRALKTGDELALARPGSPAQTERFLDRALRPDYASRLLPVIEGPHFDRLDARAKEALLGATFEVGHQSDRMGYRLEGPLLEGVTEQVLSFGLVAGAMQLPPGGRPILLMADHQTAGGYPVIATVITAALPVAAQLAPGDGVGFRLSGAAEAAAARAIQRSALESLNS